MAKVPTSRHRVPNIFAIGLMTNHVCDLFLLRNFFFFFFFFFVSFNFKILKNKVGVLKEKTEKKKGKIF